MYLSTPVAPLKRRWFQLSLLIATFFLSWEWPPAVARAQAGSGVVEGRLVNKTDASVVPAGTSVEILSLSGGMRVLQAVTTDAAGRFRAEGIPAAGGLMVRAAYKEVSYYQPVTLDPSGKAALEISVYEPKATLQGVQLQDVRIAFQMDGDKLRCLESYSFDNRTRPPVTVVSSDGSFRFSKAPGILEMPRLSVLGPGAAFPLTESPLESADGRSYYSLYPLRPGVTTFEVEQTLPYVDRTYVFRKVFYQDVRGLDIGVIPQDMVISGDSLTRTQTNAERNFAVYTGGPAKAGTEVSWTISGGTATPATPADEPRGESRIVTMPTSVGQNALVVGPLVLLGFILALWYGYNMRPAPAAAGWQDSRVKKLRERRDQLITYLAVLDHRFEGNALTRREYSRLREEGMTQLRRLTALLGK